MALIKEKVNGVQTELKVFGRAFSDDKNYLKDIINVLEDAGYIIAYEGDLSVVITRLLSEVENEQQNPTA